MRKYYLSEESRQKGLQKCIEHARNEKQNRIKEYELNPKICNCCEKILPYEKRKNKYCCRSCAAKVNNIGIQRNINDLIYINKPCLNCGKKTSNKKYCSTKCQHKHRWQQKKEELDKLDDFGCDKWGCNSSVKRYFIELKGHICEVCNNTEWQGKPIPLTLDHINGNPYDWRRINLRIICANCDRQSDTYGSKNIKNPNGGRSWKKQCAAGKKFISK